jgi:phospholipid transport system substrate-binding protein
MANSPHESVRNQVPAQLRSCERLLSAYVSNSIAKLRRISKESIKRLKLLIAPRMAGMLFTSLTMATVLFGNTAAQATSSPMETVKGTVATVMGILDNPIYDQPGMANMRRAALESVLRDAVNYQEMARRSLGVTWALLSEPEQQRFTNLFLHVLRDAVASRMNTYSDDTQVIYVSERREGNFAEVRTVFKRDKEDTAVDLRLVNVSDRWLMYDAVIDGVRLLENYRSQFVHVIKEEAYVGLLAKIEAMTLLPKSFERNAVP